MTLYDETLTHINLNTIETINYLTKVKCYMTYMTLYDVIYTYLLKYSFFAFGRDQIISYFCDAIMKVWHKDSNDEI